MNPEFRAYLDSLPLRRLPYWPEGNPPPLKVRERREPVRTSAPRERPEQPAPAKPQLRLDL